MHEDAGYDQALAILKEAADSIQLLFTDVQMPPGEMNSFPLAQYCANQWPHFNTLIASGM
ncbi:hypothetical protein [Devosia sp. BK]|uniref:hypothetical protein n=1 Tax=Devosia sp. BK TaxID=2871706 RepID=UPI00293BB0CF|nr:hypothetical protein [Devosia sp. BK]